MKSARRRAQAWIRGPITTSTSAPAPAAPERHWWNTFSGRCSSSQAPITAADQRGRDLPAQPVSTGRAVRGDTPRCPTPRRRTSPTAFDIVAVTGGKPSATSGREGDQGARTDDRVDRLRRPPRPTRSESCGGWTSDPTRAPALTHRDRRSGGFHPHKTPLCCLGDYFRAERFSRTRTLIPDRAALESEGLDAAGARRNRR